MDEIVRLIGEIGKEWTVDGSKIFRNIGLAITAFFGLLVLIWRAIAADRSSKAALLQAQNSTEQIRISNETLASGLKQSEFMFEQAKLSEKRGDGEVFLSSVSMIGADKTETATIGAIYSLSKLCESNKDLTYKVIKLLSAHISEKTGINYEINFHPQVAKPVDHEQKIQSILETPYWSLGLSEQKFHTESGEYAANLTEQERIKVEELQKQLVSDIFRSRSKVKDQIPYWKMGGAELAELAKKHSAQEALDEICNLLDRYDPLHIMPVFLKDCNLSGFSFSGRNCRNFNFTNCLLRLSGMNQVSAKGCYFQNTDFRGAIATDANFDGSIFYICDFSGSNISGSSFKNCTFGFCNLIGVDGLAEKQFEGSTFDPAASGLPEELARFASK